MTAATAKPSRKTFHTGSHWGVYDVEVEDGRVVGVRPFAKDPNPSRFIDAMPGMVYDRTGGYEPFLLAGTIGCAFCGLLIVTLPRYPDWNGRESPGEKALREPARA